MDRDRIAELLQPFLSASELPAPGRLGPEELQLISTYVDILTRWNARINLTAVRGPEAIITRHFGESLFLAAYVFPAAAPAAPSCANAPHVLDLGSGAGFPGLPLKIHVPDLHLTLVESNHKKTAFLGEVIRALNLKQVSVFGGHLDFRHISGEGGSHLPGGIASPDLVTMRAVERFESALATAAALARHATAGSGVGKVALLIGRSQSKLVPQVVDDFLWGAPVHVPQSKERVLLLGRYERSRDT